MHGTMGKEKTIRTKPSNTLREALNTSYSIKGTQFKASKHNWQRNDAKRNFTGE